MKKLSFIIFLLLASCAGDKSNLANELQSIGFDSEYWISDPLSCCQEKKYKYASLVKRNSNLFNCRTSREVQGVLGQPFEIVRIGDLFTYEYLASSEYCGEKFDSSKFVKKKPGGVSDASVLSISFGCTDSIFYSMTFDIR